MAKRANPAPSQPAQGGQQPEHSSRGRRLGGSLAGWIEQHRDSAVDTLRDLLGRPLATFMTLAAVAIALALPAVLFVLLDNVKTLGGDWERSAAVSLFLQPTIDEDAAATFAAELAQDPLLREVTVISREAGLAEFRAFSGLGTAIDQLEDNPLPVVLEVQLRAAELGSDQLQPLLKALEARPEVHLVREDARWMQRFEAILRLLRTGVALLSVLLVLGVLLVVGNTIRLEIQHRRDEIRVLYQVGATAGFARRRFLYDGAWYGLFGGLLAWLLVSLIVWALSNRAIALAALYQSSVQLHGPNTKTIIALLAGGTLLGIIGSWIAANRHIRQEIDY